MYLYTLLLVSFGVAGAKYVKETCENGLIGCEELNPGICTKYPEWATIFCPKFCGSCPTCEEGWVLYSADKTCLKIFGKENKDQRANWFNAERMCQYTGGSLVKIQDQNKNDFVLEMLGNSTNPMMDQMWLGVKNYPTKDNRFDFKYVDGSPLGHNGTFVPPWLPKNPDNYYGQEECVTMYPKGDFPGQWNDFRCLIPRIFMCSKSADIKGVAMDI